MNMLKIRQEILFADKILQNITLAETLRLCMAVNFKKKQDRQCRDNVTPGRFRTVIVEIDIL